MSVAKVYGAGTIKRDRRTRTRTEQLDVALETEIRRHLDPEVSMRFVRLGITAAS
jgi:hypothetical protein